MNVALLNTVITFQEAVITTDSIGNKKDVWEDKYTCHATISSESARENFNAESILDRGSASFTVRYCSYIKDVKPTTHRIIWGGDAYNIEGIDHLNNKRKSIKFITRKERP